MKTLAIAVVTTFALSTSAFAQDDPDLPDPDAVGGGEETEMPVDDSAPVPFDEEGTAPSGAEEDPDAPTVVTTSSDDGDDGARGAGGTLQARPLLLRSGSGQLRWFGGLGGLTEKRAYKKRNSDEGGFRAGGTLSAQYGITDKIQLGLNYGTGTYGDTDVNEADNKEYASGKAASIEVHYGLLSWVAVQVELPILLDPFEMGLTLGLPLKFRFGDRIAIFLLEDFFTMRFTDMVPFVDDAVSNSRASAAVNTNVEQDRGDITVKGGVIYQISPKTAFRGTFGIVAADFEMEDQGVILWGDLVHSLSKNFDVEARAGFANVAEPGDTFTLAVGAAFRI